MTRYFNNTITCLEIRHCIKYLLYLGVFSSVVLLINAFVFGMGVNEYKPSTQWLAGLSLVPFVVFIQSLVARPTKETANTKTKKLYIVATFTLLQVGVGCLVNCIAFFADNAFLYPLWGLLTWGFSIVFLSRTQRGKTDYCLSRLISIAFIMALLTVSALTSFYILAPNEKGWLFLNLTTSIVLIANALSIRTFLETKPQDKAV